MQNQKRLSGTLSRIRRQHSHDQEVLALVEALELSVKLSVETAKENKLDNSRFGVEELTGQIIAVLNPRSQAV